MDEKVKQFADYITRKQLEESQKAGRVIALSEMARRMGVPQPTLSSYQNGARLPDTINAYKIYYYFRDPYVLELLGLPMPATNDPLANSILGMFVRLPEDKQREVIAFAQKLAGE